MRVLITGGSGTVGSACVAALLADGHQVGVFSRGEKAQWELKTRFPEINCQLGGVEHLAQVLMAYDSFKPTAVIHAAAVKHIDMAEQQPVQTCRVNVQGSLNIIEASVTCRVPVTVGVSTDKACQPSVYGLSKYLMERCFLAANTMATRFAVCRFGNVAKSNGSVIPRWLAAASRGEALTVTDPEMCRMMMSPTQAAQLIQQTLTRCSNNGGGFVLLRRLKQVNILDLANQISSNVQLVGRRPGEQLHETLLRDCEIQFSQMLPDDYIQIGQTVNPDLTTRFDAGYNSDNAERMSTDEIQELLTT